MSLMDRLRLQLTGHIYIGDRQKEGWREPLPFYKFKCPIHGWVENYPQGFSQRLECPECLKERSKA